MALLTKEYPYRIVAVVDILATSARIRGIKDDIQAFRNMRKFFEDLTNQIRNIERGPQEEASELRNTIKVSTFEKSHPVLFRQMKDAIDYLDESENAIKCIMMSDTIIMYVAPTENNAFNIIQSLLDFSRHCILQGVL